MAEPKALSIFFGFKLLVCIASLLMTEMIVEIKNAPDTKDSE